LPFGAPGDSPPCIRQRPFGIAGDRQRLPLLVRAPHRRLRCMVNLPCMGLILRFLLAPSPRGFDRADHGLAASADVHMLERHLLLKAGFRSLGDAWADTTSAHGRLMLTVLGGLAESDRESLKSRTGEGRDEQRLAGLVWGGSQSLHYINGGWRESLRPRSLVPTMSVTAQLADWVRHRRGICAGPLAKERAA
jgi:hypothetical protein